MEIKKAFSNYFSDLASVGRDFAVPYRHFAHWNVSKLATFLYALVAGFVFSIPLLLAIAATIYYALSFPAGEATVAMLSQNSITPLLMQAVVVENIGKIAFVAFLGILVITVFSVFVSYGYFLLANVYRSYLEGTELPVLKNRYFDWKAIWKFTATLGWSSLYVLVPLVIGALVVLGIALVAYFSGWSGESITYKTGIVTTVTLALTFGFVIYFAFRTGFSTFALLADQGSGATGREYVRRSMAMTKGKVARAVLLVIPFSIVVGIGETVLEQIDASMAVSRMYDEAVKLKEQTGKDKTDADFVSDYVDRALSNDDASMAVSIIGEHKPQKDGIDRAFFNEISPFLDRSELDVSSRLYESLFKLLSFLLLDGLMIMAYLSAFVRFGGNLRDPETEAPVTDDAESGDASDFEKPASETTVIEKTKKSAAKKEKSKDESAPAKKPAVKKPATKKPAAKKSAV